MRLKLLVALPLVVSGVWLAAPTASAQQSENASCVAVFIHGGAGPPGLFQSDAHVSRFGDRVSAVAHSGDECPLYVA